MNELKPEDVMRALERRGEETLFAEIINENVYRVTFADVLALFRENRSQISVLKKLLERCETQFAEKDAEIEKLETAFEKEYVRVEHLMRQLETARAEAITEFAKLWKKWWYGQIQVGVNAYQESIIYDYIDQIAEKLKGETDGKTDL